MEEAREMEKSPSVRASTFFELRGDMVEYEKNDKKSTKEKLKQI